MRTIAIFLLSLCIILFPVNIFAQKKLQAEGGKDMNSISTMMKDGLSSARVIVQSTLALSYDSNMGDLTADNIKRGIVNGLHSDTLYFYPTPDDKKRRVHVSAYGYPEIIISFTFHPKETYKYLIFDPSMDSSYEDEDVAIADTQQKQSKIKPRWMSETPKPSNNTFEYKVFSVDATSPTKARKKAAVEVSYYLEKTFNVKVESFEETNVQTKNINGKETYAETSDFRFKSEVKEQPISISSKIIDEYRIGNTFYFLCAVAKPNASQNAVYDDVILTNKYGGKGLVRSLVPGWGQMYKGSMAKGGIIIGAEALSIGGIVVCESMRASYEKKMQEDPRHIQEYSTSADGWANGRNACIAVAAAIYVYNLIDAAVAPGARRVVNRNNNLAIMPTIHQDHFGQVSTGLGLVYKF